MRWLLPVCGIVTAGFVVLLYGIAMFGPLADCMHAIATRVPDTEVDKGVVTSPSLLDQTFCTCNCAVKAGSGAG